MSAAPDTRGLAHGEHRRACLVCNRGKRDTALAIKVDDRGATWLCHRCGFSGANNVTHRTGVAPIVAHSTVHEILNEYGRELWDACRPLAGEARAYLEARCCVVPPRDDDLRWHRTLRHPCGYEGPALVALATDAVTGQARTLHRTWVNADGTKAPVDRPRLLLKGHRKAGAVVRLWPDEAVTTGLAIGEGIETCLAAAHVYTPVWSALDAGNLAAFPVLPAIEHITVFADRDDAGLLVARTCGSRWRSAGREVRVRVPRVVNDVCDLVAA